MVLFKNNLPDVDKENMNEELIKKTNFDVVNGSKQPNQKKSSLNEFQNSLNQEKRLFIGRGGLGFIIACFDSSKLIGMSWATSFQMGRYNRSFHHKLR